MPKICHSTQNVTWNKHIAIPYHFFISKIEELEIKVVAISIHDQLADQLIKGLTEVLFVKTRKVLMGW